jgi:ribosomal protein L6P/L9E
MSAIRALQSVVWPLRRFGIFQRVSSKNSKRWRPIFPSMSAQVCSAWSNDARGVKKMFELRLVGSGYRIYCTRSNQNELIVLGFGSKESQRIDIATAHTRYRNFFASSES